MTNFWRVLALDPGTANTGYATVETTDVPGAPIHICDYWGVLKTDKQDGTVRERIDALGTSLEQLIKTVVPTHIAIEDFTEQGVNAGRTFKEMAWLTEHFRMVSRFNGFEAVIYDNGVWKQAATGSTRLNKDQVKHFVTHRVQGSEVLKSKRAATHVWDSVGIGYAHIINLRGGT